MPLRILIVAATPGEAEILKGITSYRTNDGNLMFMNKEISVLVTGVGTVSTAWALTKLISGGFRPDLAVNIGIAGSFTDDQPLGKVVLPVSDCFADAGVDSGDGFKTLAEAGFQDPEKFPFRGGILISENRYIDKLSGRFSAVSAITVNTGSGSENHIRLLKDKYKPGIETMEGAAFFYVCLMENIPFVALRAISNKVEPRNKNKWNIPLALENLTEGLRDALMLIN